MKLYIVGGAGSGKTTLAKKLVQQFDCAYLDLDTVKWNGSYSESRDKKERAQIISDFLQENENWVCEGVYTGDWINKILLNSDEVFILQVPLWKRQYRCIKRALKRRTESMAELVELLKWNLTYDKKELSELIEKLNKMNLRYRIITGNSVQILMR